MTNLTESILSYISRDETDYALLITGGWGTGKTFYFKEVFKKELEVKYSDYKLIYVSLYGISSIKEISILIYDQINPLKAKAMKYGGFLSKVALRGIDLSELFSLELGSGEDKKVIKGDSKSMSEHFSDFFKINKQKIDKSKILLCFDDLERKDSSLTITQISGFINSLLEEQTKIIVIANSNQVKEEEFTFLKEKTFGIQLEFPKNNKQNVVQLIDKTFEKHPLFQTWLKSKIEYFDNIFFQYEDNLRVFKLALQHFHKVYSYIESQKFNYKYIIFEELYNDILRFICAVTIEFRKGKLSYYERNDIDNNFWSYTDIWTAEMRSQILQKTDDIAPHVPNFKETYYQGIKYKFYKSIYDLITSEYLSNLDLDIELEEIEKNVTKPEYKVLEKISDNNFHNYLDDEVYKELLLKALNFAYNGIYKTIGDYLSVYSFVNERSGNYDIILDEEQFFLSIRKFVSHCELQELKNSVYHYNSIYKNTYPSSMQYFIEKLNDIISQETIERNQRKLIEIKDASDFEQLITYFKERQTLSVLHDDSIVDSILNHLINASTPQLYEFAEILNTRYRKNYIEENPQIELNSLKYFEIKIDEVIGEIENNKPNRKFQFGKIKNMIRHQIEQIEKISLPKDYLVD